MLSSIRRHHNIKSRLSARGLHTLAEEQGAAASHQLINATRL